MKLEQKFIGLPYRYDDPNEDQEENEDIVGDRPTDRD